MVTDNFARLQYDLLLKEWALCDSNIGRLDTVVFVIRGWAIGLATAIVAYAYTKSDPVVCYLAVLPLVTLWIIDAVFKSFQRIFILRNRTIENYLSSQNLPLDLEADRLSIEVPATARAFGTGDDGEWLARVLKAAFLRNVLVSYIPIILIVVATGFLVEYLTTATP